MPSPWELAFLSPIGGRSFSLWLLEKYVPRMAEQAAGRERIPWIAVMVGIFERILFTTLVAYDVSRGGSFIVA
jgi:hypothetical protein